MENRKRQLLIFTIYYSIPTNATATTDSCVDFTAVTLGSPSASSIDVAATVTTITDSCVCSAVGLPRSTKDLKRKASTSENDTNVESAIQRVRKYKIPKKAKNLTFDSDSNCKKPFGYVYFFCVLLIEIHLNLIHILDSRILNLVAFKWKLWILMKFPLKSRT